MKNHFLYAYSGNKRNEIESLFNIINFDNITTIVEPFCGSSAMSYYISTKHPKKFKYILNDMDDQLIKIYNIFKSEDEIETVNEKINILIDNFNSYTNDEERKNYYLTLTKNNDIESYIFIHKYCSIRKGLYPQMTRIKQIKKLDLRTIPIYNFIKNEDVTFTINDGLNVLINYKDDKSNLLLIDPPYMSECNVFYKTSALNKLNIYEYMHYNSINEYICDLYLIVSRTWTMELLFKNNIKLEYDKIYQMKKKHTKHIIISKV